jgi:hypothetical protein
VTFYIKRGKKFSLFPRLMLDTCSISTLESL